MLSLFIINYIAQREMNLDVFKEEESSGGASENHSDKSVYNKNSEYMGRTIVSGGSSAMNSKSIPEARKISSSDINGYVSGLAKIVPVTSANLQKDADTNGKENLDVEIIGENTSASCKEESCSESVLKQPPRKKKVQWKKEDNLQLQLKLKVQSANNRDFKESLISATYINKFGIKSPASTLILQTPKNTIFSPLRLKKIQNLHQKYHISSDTHIFSPIMIDKELFTPNKYSISSKYAFQFYPTMTINKTDPSNSNTTISPVLITSKVNTSPYAKYTRQQLHALQKSSSSNDNYQPINKNKKLPCYKNDYSNNYIHSGKLPFKYIRNSKQQVEGYPKLQKLYKLKEQQIQKHLIKPYGCRVETKDLIRTLNSWVHGYALQFDVIMIGALTENQLIYPLLTKLPLDKLCSKPGFLFIWASTQKISELSTLLNDSNTWSKKFRRSEELVFIPVDKNSVYYPSEWSIPEDQILEEIQWHCWMCITGTVRRSTDKDLIHCNINTDLSLENEDTGNSAVPSQIYKVVENFSSSTRRLHIIPTATGIKKHVKLRPGWVIVSPDAILDNFEPNAYKRDIETVGSKIPYNEEIEQLRPKTPC